MAAKVHIQQKKDNDDSHSLILNKYNRGFLSSFLRWLQYIARKEFNSSYLRLYRFLLQFFLFLSIVAFFLIYLVSVIFVFAGFLMRKNSVKKNGSFTSILVTNYRFYGNIFGICNDRFAEFFSASHAKIEAIILLLRGLLFGEYILPYSVFSMGGRCNSGDEEVRSALLRGFSQIIVLGAGNDTRLHRLAPLPQHLFEVDAELTQKFKLRHLPAEVVNRDVVFLPVNFEDESWLDRLRATGGEGVLQRKTLIIWDGVSYYLSAAAIRQTLSCVAAFPVGSRLILDVCNPNPKQLAKINRVFTFLFGEPWLSVFNEDSLRSLLSEHGLRLEGAEGEGLTDAANWARHSSDPAFEGKVRIPRPDMPAEESLQRPFLLAAAVVLEKDQEMEGGKQTNGGPPSNHGARSGPWELINSDDNSEV